MLSLKKAPKNAGVAIPSAAAYALHTYLAFAAAQALAAKNSVQHCFINAATLSFQTKFETAPLNAEYALHCRLLCGASVCKSAHTAPPYLFKQGDSTYFIKGGPPPKQPWEYLKKYKVFDIKGKTLYIF